MDRKCHHNYEHGNLYICDGYSEETKNQINELQKKFQKQCADGSVIISCTYRNGKTISKSFNEWINEK